MDSLYLVGAVPLTVDVPPSTVLARILTFLRRYEFLYWRRVGTRPGGGPAFEAASMRRRQKGVVSPIEHEKTC